MYLIDDVGKGDQFEYRVALASKESKDFDYFGPIQSVSNLSTNSFHEKKKLGRDSPSILGWRTDNILWQYLKQREGMKNCGIAFKCISISFQRKKSKIYFL